MNFKRFAIDGPVLIEPRVFGDERGFFFESYKDTHFEKEGLPTIYKQDNHSRSQRGVLRGLHFQIPPYAQGKLVRVVRGAVMDVIVDIRKNSPTFGDWIAEELNEANKKIFFVPPGFAHGFLTLEDNTDFLYKVTEEYAPDFEKGITPFDGDLQIPWKKWLEHDFILSKKDSEAPSLLNFGTQF